jgi:hypothetical protein
MVPTAALPFTMSSTAQVTLVSVVPVTAAVRDTLPPESTSLGGFTSVTVSALAAPWLPPPVELPPPPQADWTSRPAMANPCSIMIRLFVRTGTSACLKGQAGCHAILPDHNNVSIYLIELDKSPRNLPTAWFPDPGSGFQNPDRSNA